MIPSVHWVGEGTESLPFEFRDRSQSDKTTGVTGHREETRGDGMDLARSKASLRTKRETFRTYIK